MEATRELAIKCFAQAMRWERWRYNRERADAWMARGLGIWERVTGEATDWHGRDDLMQAYASGRYER